MERPSNQFLSPAKVFAKLKSKVQRDNEAAHGAAWRTAGCWKEGELKDNHRFAFDAKALTLSPIESPPKNVDDLHFNFSRSAVGEMTLGHVTGDVFRRGHTPTKRHLMESTAVFHPLLLAPSRESVALRTPVKNQRRFEGCAPLDTPPTPSTVISPMAKRLRSRHTGVPSNRQSPKTTSTAGRDGVTSMEDLGVRGYSPADTNRISYQPRTAKHRPEMKCYSGSEERLSSAKMFAYMKQRENRRQQQEVQNVRRHIEELSEAEEMEDNIFWTASESPSSVPVAGLKFTDGHPNRDAPLSPQPVLFEDPIILNTPRISIPKKHKATLKHNQWPQHSMFPSESVIHLKQWFLQRNPKGLFVQGLRKEDNIPWNSNIIVERVSTLVLKSVSGRVYILVGRMKLNVDSEFPQFVLKKFLNGFPPNWKELYEKFLSAPSSGRETQATIKQKSSKSKKTPEAPATKAPVKSRRQTSVKTPDSCPPSLSLTKVSRSGRVIKPPLEYWKGGRVILDAQMNVTVFECYDTSICSPPVTSVTGVRESHRPVSRSCSEGRKQQESTSNPELPATLRRVRASHCAHPRTNVHPEQRLPSAAVESRHTSSSDEGSDRKRLPAAASRSLLDTQSETEKPSTRKTRGHQRPAGRKRPADSSTDNRVSACQLSVDEIPVKRKKRNVKVVRKMESSQSEEEERGEQLKKTARAMKHGKQTNGTLHKSSKPSPATKPLPKIAQPNRKPRKDNTVFLPEDEEWTEDELFKLQQAVSHYPRYVTGYWEKVAMMVGTRSAEECLIKHRPHENTQTPPKKTSKTRKEKVEAPKPQNHPVITARLGTLKRKQQVRQFLDAMPQEDMEDVFTCQQMQMERFEMPPSSRDQDSSLTNFDPLTPTSRCLPEVKTPHCPHVTPGMMDSQSRKNRDIKYIFHLEQRRKKAAAAKSFTPSPPVKPTMRRCGNMENDPFVVWEMFPEEAGVLDDSGEEEDFYFSDND